MGEAAGSHLPLQRLCDMCLAHHIVKGAGPPLPVECLIQRPSLPKQQERDAVAPCPSLSYPTSSDAEQDRTPVFEYYAMSVTQVANSRTATLRHTEGSA